MDEVARRSLAAPFHQGTNNVLIVESLEPHQDLQGRIRSLLASRNEHKPPRTPLPTPDWAGHSPRPTSWSSDYFGVAGHLDTVLGEKLREVVSTRKKGFQSASYMSDNTREETEARKQDEISIASDDDLQKTQASEQPRGPHNVYRGKTPALVSIGSHPLEDHITPFASAPANLNGDVGQPAPPTHSSRSESQACSNDPFVRSRTSAIDQLRSFLRSAQNSMQSLAERSSSTLERTPPIQSDKSRTAFSSSELIKMPENSPSPQASLKGAVPSVPQASNMEKYEPRYTEKSSPRKSVVSRLNGFFNQASEVPPNARLVDLPETYRKASGKAQDANVVREQQPDDAHERFNEAIASLHKLLDEALQIAADASDTDNLYPERAPNPSFLEGPLTSKENLTKQSSLASHHGRRRQNQVAFNEPGSSGQIRRPFKRRPTPFPVGSGPRLRHTSSAPTRHRPSDEGLFFQASEGSSTSSTQQDVQLETDRAPIQGASKTRIKKSPLRRESIYASDLSSIPEQRAPAHRTTNPKYPASLPEKPKAAAKPLKEACEHLSRHKLVHPELATKQDVKRYLKAHHEPPIEPRRSSTKRRPHEEFELETLEPEPLSSKAVSHPYWEHIEDSSSGERLSPGVDTLHGSETNLHHLLEFEGLATRRMKERSKTKTKPMNIKVRGRRHVNIASHEGFSLRSSCHHQPVARDWSETRKHWTAIIACLNTALIGILIGIYAGEVPAIQYAIADFHHYAILGNVFMYLGLAVTTFFFWPLPLLHGRRPYIIIGLTITLALQIPQGIAVGAYRPPDVSTYRALLFVGRSISGFALGFTNVNAQATLFDLFGASLMSANPHQETINEHDVRRHGGGMGVWLGIWSWCYIGSIGIGFFIGALIIGSVDVSWGFWIAIFLIIAVLFLNVVSPEVRRSAYRRTISEIKGEHRMTRRVARGEVKMHLTSKGPLWWGEEVRAGIEMCMRMMKQLSFTVLAVYLAWVYAQIILVIMLLGALTSKYYRLHPTLVGLSVSGISIGAMLAIPFQKASLFSRARHHPPRTDSMTFQRQLTWSSHLVRRSLFMIALPLAGLAYTLSSGGPPLHPALPACFGGLVGFLSSLAIAEGVGLIMETFDTSDLQPGMIGGPRSDVSKQDRKQRTCFSCYPRISAGLAIVQSLSFLLAAAATGTGGGLERRLGAKEATGVVASILMGLTIMLTAVLWRFQTVKVIPSPRFGVDRRGTTWEPFVVGNPSGTTRRMNLLELGKQSRWMEVRRRNRLTFMEAA